MLDTKVEINVKIQLLYRLVKEVLENYNRCKLSCSLAEMGANAGLLDADIYGPNISIDDGLTALPQPKNNN